MAKSNLIILMGESFHSHQDLLQAFPFPNHVVATTTSKEKVLDDIKNSSFEKKFQDFEHLIVSFIVDISDATIDFSVIDEAYKYIEKSKFLICDKECYIYFREEGDFSKVNLGKMVGRESSEKMLYFSDMSSNHQIIPVSISFKNILQVISLKTRVNISKNGPLTFSGATLEFDQDFFKETGRLLFRKQIKNQIYDARQSKLRDDYGKSILNDLQQQLEKEMPKEVNNYFDRAPRCAHKVNINILRNLKEAETTIFANFYQNAYERKLKQLKDLYNTQTKQSLAQHFYENLKLDLLEKYWDKEYGYGYHFYPIIEQLTKQLAKIEKNLEYEISSSKGRIEKELDSKDYSQVVQAPNKKKKWYEFYKPEFPNFEEDLSDYLIENIYRTKFDNKLKSIVSEILKLVAELLESAFLKHSLSTEYDDLFSHDEIDIDNSLTSILSDFVNDLVKKREDDLFPALNEIMSYAHLGGNHVAELNSLFDKKIFSLTDYPKSVSSLFTIHSNREDIMKKLSDSLWKKTKIYSLRFSDNLPMLKDSYLVGDCASPIYKDIISKLKKQEGIPVIEEVNIPDNENIVLCNLYANFDIGNLLIMRK